MVTVTDVSVLLGVPAVSATPLPDTTFATAVLILELVVLIGTMPGETTVAGPDDE